MVSNQGVTNSGTLSAPDGHLLVSADNLTLNPDATNGLTNYVITSLDGTTTLNGVINVAGTTTNGGLIETAGAAITLGSGYQLGTGNSGTWSYSLPNITIGASGNVAASFVDNNLALRNLSLNALGGNLTVSDSVTWSSNNTLTLAALNNIYINNAITINGANAGIVLNYGGYNGINVTTPAAGTGYYILTPASYAGAVLNAQGVPVAETDTSGGVYGSITFTNSANTSGLKINGKTYTLIYSLGQLDRPRLRQRPHGVLLGPITQAYDIPVYSQLSYISGSKSIYGTVNGVYYYWDVATQAYDIPQTKVINGTTYVYDFLNKAYDIPLTQVINGTTYTYDFQKNSYDIALTVTGTTAKSDCGASTCYWDYSDSSYDIMTPYTGGYYGSNIGTSFWWNVATQKYDIMVTQGLNGSSTLYYDPAKPGITYDLSSLIFGRLEHCLLR